MLILRDQGSAALVGAHASGGAPMPLGFLIVAAWCALAVAAMLVILRHRDVTE
jgi:hypothetical protein